MIGPFLAVCLGLCLCSSWATRACATEDNVRVSLFEAFAPPRAIGVSGPLEVLYPTARSLPPGSYELAARGSKVELFALKNPERRPAITAERLVLRGPMAGLALTYPGKQARRYRGTIMLVPSSRGTLRIINELAARQYVTAVVGSETLPGWPAEALKCQAVLTQTRLCRYRPGDKLADSTQQEAYLGAAYERPEVRAAVDSVWGWVLTYKGRPVSPFYHSACAGRTSNGEDIFGPSGRLPYLRGVICGFCSRSPFQKVKRSVIPYHVYREALGEEVPVISNTDLAGRPIELRLNNGTTKGGYDFWIAIGQKLGWDKVPGTRYSLSRKTDGPVVLESTGAGHGVGLCQWGAAQLARRGWSFSQILRFYFPGTSVAR
ncbi:MAG TPA: SpoIID/LytB domain-containing protein [Candidatus Obscuribacterales bacterium]